MPPGQPVDQPRRHPARRQRVTDGLGGHVQLRHMVAPLIEPVADGHENLYFASNYFDFMYRAAARPPAPVR